MANFGSPMDYFQAGMTGGAARSPALGIGNAIRGVLDQSRKLGLIGAQSSGNLNAAMATAGFKQNIDKNVLNAAGEKPKSEAYYDSETKKTYVKNWRYDSKSGQWVDTITPATYSPYEDFRPGPEDMGVQNDIPDEEAYQIYLQGTQQGQ